MSKLVGISSQTLKDTKELVKLCNNSDVNAVVLAPLFGKGKPDNKIQLVIERSNLPILLYNNPAIQKQKNLDLNLVKKFLSNSKIIGIKDSSETAHYFEKLLKLKSKNFSIFQGGEESIIDSLKKGADGIVAGTANIYPREFKDLVLNKNPELFNKILKYKQKLASLSPNYISALKTKLFKMRIIKTNQLFLRQSASGASSKN